MKSQPRLLGIDLLRILAIFGVIVLHSDSGTRVISWSWQLVRCFFGFAVPFFLATSFYLAVSKSKQRRLQFNSRLRRLLLPYFVWSILYLFYKFAKYFIEGDTEKLSFLFLDPLGLIFCGNSAIHLYFLPLLLWGTIIVKVIEIVNFHKLSLKVSIIGFIVSFFIHDLIILSGNGFRIFIGTAFNDWFPQVQATSMLRLLLVFFAWSFWCASYIFAAKIAHHPQVGPVVCSLKPKAIFLLTIGFTTFTLIDLNFYDTPIFEVIRGYIILLIAINLSKYLKGNKIITNLSRCSFGIYFIHLIFIELIYIIGIRLAPKLFLSPSITVYLAISCVVFLLSWISTQLFLVNKRTASLFLGY